MRKPSLWTGVLGAAIALTIVAGPASAVEETKIGVTSASNLTTTGFPPVSPEHLLKIGVEVVGDERVVTTKDGRAQLLFLDHSALTVGPNSNLVLDKFVYDPDTGVGDLVFSATKGIFRLVGGRISKKTPVTIKTFSGTIGIRGGVAMVSIQKGRPVEATFLFGKEMTVCTDTLAERERRRPPHERPGEQCFADGRGKSLEGTEQSSIGTERCNCARATRPGSLVTIPSPGNVSAPVVLSSEQISATVQQLEQTPGKTTDSAVLVFQEEVKDAVLGALAEPAAGPGPTPPPPAPPVGPSVNTGDIISDSTEESTSEQIASSAPAPAAVPLSGRVKRAVSAGGFVGTGDLNPALNIPFAGVTPPGSTFDATLSSTQQLTLPIQPGLFAADSTTTPFAGILTGEGFLTADEEFVFYQLTDQGDGRDVLVWAGVPTPGSAFPASGATFYELQPDFVLKSNVPFINGSEAGVSGGGLTVPDPAVGIIDWDLGLFGGGLVAIDGAGTSQVSAASVFGGPLVGLGDPQTVDIAGQIRGGWHRSADDTRGVIDTSNDQDHFRLSRDGGGALVPPTGNGFFGSTNPDYFVLEADATIPVISETFETGGVRFNRGYSPNVVALATTDTLGPRTGRTLNGFAGGLSRRLDNTGNVIDAFMFGNTNGDPSDISIQTNAITGTASATFDVHDVLGFSKNFDRNDLSTSTVTTQDPFFFQGLTANPGAPPLFGAPALPADSTFTLPFSSPLLSRQGKFYRFNFNLPDGFSDLRFKLDVVVNDEVAIYINDSVVAIEDDTTATNFSEPTPEFILNADGTVTDNSNPVTGWDFLSINQSQFQVGNNELSIYGVDTCCNAPLTVAGSLAFLSGQITAKTPRAINAEFGGAGVSTFFDDESFGAIEASSTSATVEGATVTDVNLYVVTSEAFQSNNFAPAGVTVCACQFLKWGFWGGEIGLAGGESERIHLANWIAGDNIAAGIDLPTVGTAVYNGHVIGTVLDTGAVYQAMGGFGMNFDFANPTASTITVTGFDGVDYNANVTGLTNGIYQATGPDASALSRTMNFTGGFFGGGGDPVAETGGQFNVDGGPDYSASGIFAGAK